MRNRRVRGYHLTMSCQSGGLKKRLVRTRAEQICQQPVSARHTLRGLPMQSEGDVDVFALAEARVQETTTLRVLAGIVRLRGRRELGAPRAHEGVAALLSPSVEIGFGDS